MKTTLLIANVILLLLSPLCRAGDWPQVLGPQRNGIAEGESVAPWEGQLKVGWTAQCGGGFAGVAVAQGSVFLTHRIDDQVHLDSLDATDGKRNWRASVEASYRGGLNSDRGPRCVPVVDQGQVFCYSAGGDLFSVDAMTGDIQWTRALRYDLDAEDGFFGAGSTPIVVGSLVIVAVGGAEGGVVAVDRKTGKDKWKATRLEADYASPVVLNQSVVVFPMRLNTVGLDIAKGTEVFRIAFGQRGPNVIGATPLVNGNRLLLSASYRMGAKLVDVSKRSPTTIWEGDDILSTQYNTLIAKGDHVYGIHGREDIGVAELRCVELSSGRVMWKREGYGVAHLILADSHLIALGIDGRIELIGAESGAFRSISKHQLPGGIYRALPALSGGRLFCRSTNPRGEGMLHAVELPSR